MGRLAFRSWASALSFGCKILLAGAALRAGTVCAADARIYNIPAQSLNAALLSLATQADISIGLANVSLVNRVSRQLAGSDTVEGALRRLLAGTGLSFDMVDSSTWRIFELKVAAAAPERETTVPLIAPLIEEITVTAGKRADSLQATPISVAAVTGSTVTAYGLRSSRDVTSLVAGLTTTNQAPGKNKFIVRGLSDGPFTGNTQSTVGVYVDETRAIFNAPDPNLLLVDIDRVEVIRGPQNTLYGAGSIGGLVRLITRQPTFGTFEMQATTDGSGAGRADASGSSSAVTNIPALGDRLAVRTVAYARRDGGYINDTFRNVHHINGSDTYGGRTAARFSLSQDWTVRAGAVFQSIHNDDTQYSDAMAPRFARATLLAEPSNNRFFDVTFTVEGELGWADIVSSGAWIAHRATATYDASQALPVLLQEPPQPTVYNQNNHYETFTNETRLVSPPGKKWRWLTGVFVSHRNNSSELTLTRLDRTPRFVFYSKNRLDHGTEIAAFGEATYAFDSHISLTAGLRGYRSTQTTSADNSELIDVGPAVAFGENSKSGVTPKAGISYQPDPTMLYYAQVTQGFRMGGINIAAAIAPRITSGGRALTASNFDSDRLWNFEIGTKAALWNQRAIINATTFYELWYNTQADLIRPSGIGFTANVGDVRNYGFELDVTVVPTQQFQILANVSWSHPTLTRNSGALANSVTDRLPTPPRFSGTVAAQYDVPLEGNASAYVNLKYGVKGKAKLSHGLMPASAVNAYHIIDLRTGVQRGHWNVAAYIENITDNATNTYAFGNPFSLGRIPQVIPSRPRTFGMNVAWIY